MKQHIAINDRHAGFEIMKRGGEGVYNPRSETCIARYSGDKLMGGVVYSNYTQASLEMTVAGLHPNWLTRALLFVCFDYPFNQLHCRKVFSRINAKNERSIQLCGHLGFRVEAVLNDVFIDSDLLIFSLYKRDCRFLNLTFPAVPVRKEIEDGQILPTPSP